MQGCIVLTHSYGSRYNIIYLDFQKAFDKVPHQRLILKLKSHSLGISIINLMEQWLTDRRQRVVVDGEVSNWKSVLSGAPHGSVLWPIILLIYSNDLEESVISKLLKFVDDTILFRKIKGNGAKQQLLTFAHLCQSYPCPGSIARIAFLHASRFCASFGSSWCCLKSLRTLSIHLSLDLPRGLFHPTFIVVT